MYVIMVSLWQGDASDVRDFPGRTGTEKGAVFQVGDKKDEGGRDESQPPFASLPHQCLNLSSVSASVIASWSRPREAVC